MIQQAQSTECGLACVGMIAHYFGYQTNLLRLRQQFQTSLKGATLKDVMSIAHQLGLNGRALRLEIEEIHQLKRPCILHWDFNHFVVLKKVYKDKVVIHDPAHGVRTVKMADVSRYFTGVALELLPGSQFRKAEAKSGVSILGLMGNVLGAKSAFVQLLLVSMAIEVFGIALPFYMQWVMDHVLVSSDYDLLTLLGMGFMLAVFFEKTFMAVRSWITTWFSSLLSVQWSVNVCTHLLGLPMAYFETRHIGDIVSRFGSVNEIQKTLTHRFVASLIDGVMALVTLMILFLYSSYLSWFVVGILVLYTLIRTVFYRPFRQANEDYIVSNARTHSQLLESIRGAQAVKLNNKIEKRTADYTNILIEETNKGVAVERLNIVFGLAEGWVAGLGRIILIWLSAKQVLDGEFTAGMMMAFISFSDQFIHRATGFVGAIIEFRMLKLHGERLADIVLTEKEPHVLIEHHVPQDTVRNSIDEVPAIAVTDLSFQYAPNEPMLLEGCAFEVAAGESVAIVGPSGSGKTTLAKLLLGLLTPQSGTILIGGVDVKSMGMVAYRDMIGCVMQDDMLFSGSIAENISFFDETPDFDNIAAAAIAAQIHEDVMAMPMMYQTLVGDMGSSLSGGQIQRVLLARALYRKPKILILDESSSQLDIAKEALINQAIKEMAVTRIIIAHRLETIQIADRRLSLVGGKLIADGV